MNTGKQTLLCTRCSFAVPDICYSEDCKNEKIISRRSLFRRVCCPYSFFCQRFIGQYLEGIADIYQSRYARIGNNRE